MRRYQLAVLYSTLCIIAVLNPYMVNKGLVFTHGPTDEATRVSHVVRVHRSMCDPCPVLSRYVYIMMYA